MSKYFVEKNNESTLRLFNKRFIYKTTVFGSDENNIVSFVDGEKIFMVESIIVLSQSHQNIVY
jgi:hypothetical protein